MSNEIAILIAAGIAAGASVFTLFLTRLFDFWSEKKKEQERFFYELFPKRLKLFEEIIEIVNSIPSKQEWLNMDTTIKTIDIFIEKKRILYNICVRCAVYGNNRVLGKVKELHDSIKLYIKMVSERYEILGIEGLKEPYNEILKNKIDIIGVIEEESGTHMLDKKLAKLTKRKGNK